MTVHALKHGNTLCQKPGIPGSWRDGHRWISFEDPDVMKLVNCTACLEKLRDEPVMVGPTHPAWASFTDDDWNGATFGNWVRTLKDMTVRLRPPAGCPPKTVRGVRDAIAAHAKSVRIG